MSRTKPSAAALRRFEESFTKTFDATTLRRTSRIEAYETISTGSLALDMATGVGGYVEGRIHQLWGPEATGKTTLCLNAVREAQRKHPNKMVGYVDMEQSLDLDWALTQGVDLEGMYHFQPDSAEDVSDAMGQMLLAEDRSQGLFSMVIVDSIGGMVPETELEKTAEQQDVGTQAKIVTRMVKAGAVRARKHGTVILLVNQVRSNIAKYGPETGTSGGWALKHANTMVFKTSRTGQSPYMVTDDDGDKVQAGVQIGVQVTKNKVAAPKRAAQIGIFSMATDKYGPAGIDRADEAVTLGMRFGLIERSGGWYTAPDGHREQGRDKMVDYLRGCHDIIDAIRADALGRIRGEVVPPGEEGADAEEA